MTQGHLDTIAEEQYTEQVRKDLTKPHLMWILKLAQECGGLEELKAFIWDWRLQVKDLTPDEIIRALKRENKIKAHYNGTHKKNRGGRHNKVAEIVEHIHEVAVNLPSLLEQRLKLAAKYYGGCAPPETRISHTSQWRVNKKLKELDIAPVPWSSVKGVFTEDELEQEFRSRQREINVKKAHKIAEEILG